MRMWSLRGRAVGGALRLLGLGAALVLVALAAGNSGGAGLAQAQNFEGLEARSLSAAWQTGGDAPGQIRYVLIIVGEFKFPANIVAVNIAEEAISDFKSLGYTPVTIYWKNRDTSYVGILRGDFLCELVGNYPDWFYTRCGPSERKVFPEEIWKWLDKPSVKAIVLITHGLKSETGCEEPPAFNLKDRAIRWPEGVCLAFDKDYVILHSCCQDNETTRAFFMSLSPPGTPYPKHCDPSLRPDPCFKGHKGLGVLYADWFWQWLRFPSEGPHEGHYIPIPFGALLKMPTEDLVTLEPDVQGFDIPNSAEGPARDAFLDLARAHNALISGDEIEAIDLIGEAYCSLRAAYNAGWEAARDLADELSTISGFMEKEISSKDRLTALVPSRPRKYCTSLIAAAVDLERELEAEASPTIKDPVCQSACPYAFEGLSTYLQRFRLAFEAGEAPDILACGSGEIGWLAEGGYIIPLDAYVEKHWDKYNLGNILPRLWEAVKYNGHIYGFPQVIDSVQLIYFRKDILRELDWSEDEINALPEKVKRGEFTLDDMIEVAKQAMAAGVSSVDGFPLEWGIYHRPSPGGELHMIYLDYGGILQDPETGKLVLDKDAMLKALQFYYNITQVAKVTPPGMTTTSWRSIHEDFVEGRVLFWFGGTRHWAEWQRVAYHKKLGGLPEEYEWENIGFMLVPAAEKGGRPVALWYPFIYTITSQSEAPELAFRWAALTSKPELVAMSTLEGFRWGEDFPFYLSVLKENTPEYNQWRFGSAVSYMLDYASFIPNHTGWGTYYKTVYNAIQAVEYGEMFPGDALIWLVDELTRELVDQLIIK